MADSIAKGGGSLMLARMLGMVFSFLLFLILARYSATDAGTFRTVFTYLIIAESLGMLGMHRWLTVEIASNQNERWRLFLATSAVMLVVSAVLTVVYLLISYVGFYGNDLNQGLQLAALAVIPTGIYQCVQSVWVGMGKNQLLSKYNAAEYIVRCSIGILLIYLGYEITDVILVFVITRWCVSLHGLNAICQTLKANTWQPSKHMVKLVLRDAPKFVIIIIAFLLLRNSAIVMLPAIISEVETAVYAVAYQLFDLILLIPSVLAITSNHVFVDRAAHSTVALKRVSTQLLYVVAVVMFPCIVVTMIFAENFVHFLYGDQYLRAQYALIFLMLASGLAMLDMVLSQIMMARKDYQSDMQSIVVGGLCAVVLTYFLTYKYGATGAAVALMLASLTTVLYRLRVIRHVFPVKLLFSSFWRPLLAAIACLILAGCCMHYVDIFDTIRHSKFVWIAVVPFVLCLYGLLLFFMGGLNLPKRLRLKRFLLN